MPRYFHAHASVLPVNSTMLPARSFSSLIIVHLTTRSCLCVRVKVRKAYQTKGWAFVNAEAIEQCEREGFVDAIKVRPCSMSATHAARVAYITARRFARWVE